MARILLIDDDEQSRLVIREMLASAKHDVIEAGSGRLGLQALKSGEFDVIVTDILMPGIDGIEVIKRVIDGSHAIPVIAVSGGSAAMPAVASVTMSRAFGATKALYKPLRASALLAAVDEVVAPNRRSKIVN